ncbi:hypothetical protein [Streptomyces sp. NPDC058295]|uniref:DUF6197 family protein n=1 Tax=Streptomyces sp. NPDC058295 TaxID=3346431 RepID=UPI0036EEC8EC
MRSVPHTLRLAAHLITYRGLHTGDQFATTPGGPLDICAAVYAAAEQPWDLPEKIALPPEFYTDEVASLAIIGASAGAMAAIRAISEALDTPVCHTEIAPGHHVPDYIEHVSNWAATASPVHPKRPPTVGEVIGRILRASNAPTAHAA